MCQDERHRRGRTRDAHVAVDEEMGVLLVHEIATKTQEHLDILALGQAHARHVVDDVVEAQIEPVMLTERAEGVGIGKAGIEDREHVRDAACAVAFELGDAADGDAESDEITGAGLRDSFDFS